MDREALAAGSSERVEAMLAGGAIEEVELALERGASRTARKALGFKEIAAHLAGELEPRRGRRADRARPLAYVKRQLTWMRKLAGVEMIDRTGVGAAEAAARILAARLAA